MNRTTPQPIAGGLDPQTELRIQEIADRERERRGISSAEPRMITRQARPEELDPPPTPRPMDRVLAQPIRRPAPAPTPVVRERAPLAVPPLARSGSASTPATPDQPTGSRAAVPEPAPAPGSSIVARLLTEGFGVVSTSLSGRRETIPVVTCRREGQLRLNKQVTDVFGPLDSIFVLVDQAARRLAIVAGTVDDAALARAVPRSVRVRGGEAIFTLRAEVLAAGMQGETGRQFQPSTLEPGLVIVSVETDELSLPPSKASRPKSAAAAESPAAAPSTRRSRA